MTAMLAPWIAATHAGAIWCLFCRAGAQLVAIHVAGVLEDVERTVRRRRP